MITFDLILVLGRKSIEIKMGIPCKPEAVPATVIPVPLMGISIVEIQGHCLIIDGKAINNRVSQETCHS